MTIQGEGVLLGAPTVFVRTGGCDFRCSWCVAPETPILMGDWTQRLARDICVGDEIVGTRRRAGVPEAVGRYQVGKVEGVAVRQTRLLRLTFDDGRDIVVAAEHAFTLLGSGRFVSAGKVTPEQRLRALPRPELWRECAAYRAGYLSGAADGDGSFHLEKTKGVWHFVLATADAAILDRFRKYAAASGFALNAGRHLSGGDFAPARHIGCLRLTRSLEVERFRRFLHNEPKTLQFQRGYFAGIYDTDGSTDGSTLSVHQFKDAIREKITACLCDLKLEFSTSPTGFRLRGGRQAARRLLLETRPALERKTRAHFETHGGMDEYVRVSAVAEAGQGEVISIKTSLGTYIANGMLSRNCDTLYAVLPEHSADWAPLSAQEILSRVLALTGGKPILITLSGGNPALAPLEPLIKLGKAQGFSFAMETQGSVARAWFSQLDHLVLSPKPPSSGMQTRWERVAKCVEAAKAPCEYSHDANAKGANAQGAQVSLKIVVFDEADYVFAREAAARFPHLPMTLQPGTPQLIESDDASTRETLNARIAARVEWLIQCVARDGWYDARIMPQTHVLLWGNIRGV